MLIIQKYPFRQNRLNTAKTVIFAKNSTMISFQEAYEIVLQSSRLTETERVALADATGRILAGPVIADIDMPPFDKSAVDGFACRRADVSEPLEVIEVVAAGKKPQKTIGKGQCSQIMTGAIVPETADTVLMVEYTEWIDSEHIRFTGEKTANNICYRAEDVATNQVVLDKGTLIRPQEVAVLATFGYTLPLVYKKPIIGVISTGDELVEPESKPKISQIRNSNGSQTMAQAKIAGAEGKYFGIANDTELSLISKIGEALESSDIVILTGGVSMGEFDFVPDVLKSLGVDIKFKSIAIQPGRPTLFGVKGEKYLFGLPGNPVSSFIQFELLVKPLIYKMMGHDFQPLSVKIPMGETYSRKKTTRKTAVMVDIREGMIYPVEYHGSAHISSVTGAKGFIWLEIGQTTVAKGELADVRQF